MAIRQIVTDVDPLLRKKSREVTDFDRKLWDLIDDMRDTMRFSEGAGLAAPQVGILRRVVVIETPEVYLEMVNPRIAKTHGSQTGYEGCLSVKGKSAEVTRPMEVTAEYRDRNGEKRTVCLSGLAARACCHEVDHLEGILFYDHADELYAEEA